VDLGLPNYRIKASSTKLSYILVSLKKNRGCSSNFIQVQWELRPVHANEVRVFFPQKKPNNKNYHTHIKSKSVVLGLVFQKYAEVEFKPGLT
jgi:hypothetical protein